MKEIGLGLGTDMENLTWLNPSNISHIVRAADLGISGKGEGNWEDNRKCPAFKNLHTHSHTHTLTLRCGCPCLAEAPAQRGLER